MLQAWDREYPGRIESIFGAMSAVVPSHLADAGLFDFSVLESNKIDPASLINVSSINQLKGTCRGEKVV